MASSRAQGGRRRREPGGAEAIEGRNAVLESLRAGVPLRRIIVAEGADDPVPIVELLGLARERGVPVDRVVRAVLDGMSERGGHQGVIAEAEPYRYSSLEDVLRRSEGSPRSLVIVLDHVTDPHNLGAVARSAEVAGGDAVVIARRRSAGVTAAVYRASAGAVAHVPVVRVANLTAALGEMKRAGYWVAGASEQAADTLWDAPLEGRLAVVLGSEGAGLSRLVAEACDFTVGIPVAGRVSSLNVAQAATVLAFEWVRRGRE